MDRSKFDVRRLRLESLGLPRAGTMLRFTLPMLLIGLTFGGSLSCSGQMIFRGGFGGFEVADGQQGPDVESSGVLKTDPDLESILQQAERIKEDGNYRVASQLWQAVLQRSGDSLYSADGKTYFSLVQQVEAILANLPPEGLKAYRVLADAEAKEILAQASGPDDVDALNQVVRSYFISSFGDEAAYSLGCVYLDQYDFIGARRLFEKILNQHPDPSIPQDQLHSRIALCQAFLGDSKLATQSLQQAADLNSNSEQVEQIQRSLDQLGTAQPDRSYLTSWVNPLGDARRYGTMPPLPRDALSQDLAAVWQFYYAPQRKYYKAAADVKGQMLLGDEASGEDVMSTVVDLEEELVKSWRDKSWRPAGHLLLDGDRVYFKTGSDISVWNRDKVSKLVKANVAGSTNSDEAVQWRSVWHNIFQIDEATRMLEMVRQNYGGGRRSVNRKSSSAIPTGMTEVQFFGDKIYQQMSIHDGRFYAIEGKSFGISHKTAPSTARPQWNSSVRRSRENYLTAYDSVNGQLLWTLPRDTDDAVEAPSEIVAEEEDSPWLSNGGFMSAPIGYGDILLAPVNNGGAISIYALDPKQEGKTIWKSFLCDEPETGAVPWSAINLSIQGSDLFVSCGMGVVFVLDPASGAIRFAKRYERSGKRDTGQNRNSWMPNRLTFEGWSSDIIIPYRKQMICFNSDSDWIVAYDRNTGKMIWKSETAPVGYKVDYILGIYNDTLYAAGFETLIAYDLTGTGRMVWGSEQEFDGKQSLGRGVLTPSGIYMPVEDSIYHFDLNGNDGSSKVIAKAHVDLGTKAPVGNLYSDGQRFWVHGANRLYALGPAGKVPAKKGAAKASRSVKGIAAAGFDDSDGGRIDRHLKEAGIVAKKTKSGLRYVIKKAGVGPAVAAGATVKVHYHGTLLDGTVFDSSIDRGGEPPKFKLNQVIPGWAEGIGLLNKGAKATLYIPSELAYGDRAIGLIQANSILKFDVELLAFE